MKNIKSIVVIGMIFCCTYMLEVSGMGRSYLRPVFAPERQAPEQQNGLANRFTQTSSQKFTPYALLEFQTPKVANTPPTQGNTSQAFSVENIDLSQQNSNNNVHDMNQVDPTKSTVINSSVNFTKTPSVSTFFQTALKQNLNLGNKKNLSSANVSLTLEDQAQNPKNKLQGESQAASNQVAQQSIVLNWQQLKDTLAQVPLQQRRALQAQLPRELSFDQSLFISRSAQEPILEIKAENIRPLLDLLNDSQDSREKPLRALKDSVALEKLSLQENTLDDATIKVIDGIAQDVNDHEQAGKASTFESMKAFLIKIKDKFLAVFGFTINDISAKNIEAIEAVVDQTAEKLSSSQQSGTLQASTYSQAVADMAQKIWKIVTLQNMHNNVVK